MHQYRVFIVLFVLLLSLVACNKKKIDESMFVLLSPNHTSIEFINKLTEKVDNNILTSENFYNGAGISAGDVNNDGLIDLYLISNQNENKLYLNKGEFEFEDITTHAKVEGHNGLSTGSSMIDINADGLLDIYVSYSTTTRKTDTRNQLFINNGDLTFTESAKNYGLQDTGQSNQSAFLDYDLDGDLDVFLLNHQIHSPNMDSLDFFRQQLNHEAGDRFYRNDGDTFTDVTSVSGINSHLLGFGLGVGVGDLNDDGLPDIYVSNDFIEHDYLYINNGNGTFTESSKSLLKHIPNFSMGNDIADFNNDGMLDVVSLDMIAENNYDIKTNMSGMDPEKFWFTVDNGFHYQYMYNTLQMNMGWGKFSELGKLAGVANTDWSWGPLIADFDNDGHKDIFITNGFRRNFRNNDFQIFKKKKYLSKKWSKRELLHLMLEFLENMPVKLIPNYMFHQEDNLSFTNKALEWGLDEPSFSNGAAYADLDNDGDLDLIVNNIDQQAFVYRNNVIEKLGHHFLKFSFKGPKKNPDGIGAKVSIWRGGELQYAEHYLTRGYMSSVARGIHFGLGERTSVDSAQVEWPGGRQQTLANLQADVTIELNYEESLEPIKKPLGKKKYLFTDVTKDYPLSYIHLENDFDDYAFQVLLPHKYSQFGPSLSVADVNGDDLDDFYLGGAAGQSGVMYLQKSTGPFQNVSGPWEAYSAREDISSLFFDANGDGNMDLLVVSGGNEFNKGNSNLGDQLYLNDGQGRFTDVSDQLPDLQFSGSEARPCDFDNDGDIDLFVGERHIPHHYPMLASGYLYENTDGTFEDVTAEKALGLSDIGLVTDATWSDVDGDQDQDLIVVGEWMGITIYYNENGLLINHQTLSDSEGWWYSVSSADFDRDGDQDLVAGNLGLNYKYKATKEAHFEVYASDFDSNNELDIVLGFHEGNQLYPLRGRECSSDQMPFVKKKFPTYEEFAKATIEDILGTQKMGTALNRKANTFATTYFENLGEGRFAAKELPVLTQLSSVNAIEIEDFDEDGHLDMVLTGNLYTSEVETPRNDASYGVYLKGDGTGNFTAQYPYESGLYADGDVKRTARIMIKGQPHLLLAVNDGPLKIISVNTMKGPGKEMAYLNQTKR